MCESRSDEKTDDLLASRSWDAVVGGAGMGGATLAFALARRGLRVLVVERGRNLVEDPEVFRGRCAENHPEFDSQPSRSLNSAGRENRSIVWNGTDIIPEVGAGAGGSTALYGGILERFFQQDFEPRQHFDPADSDLPESWPVSYSEMEPFYRQAEDLFEVCGGPDPLRNEGTVAPDDWLSRRSRELAQALKRRGLHPYPARRGRPGPNCDGCQGFLCANGCKRDAGAVALQPAMKAGATCAFGCEIEHIEANRSRVRSMYVRRAGRRFRIEGRIFALACGALWTPALLLGSRCPEWPHGVANRSGMVGRCLMRHGIDIWALRNAPLIESPYDAKGIAFSDFYFFEREKLGAVQSFGSPAPLAYLRRQPNAAIHWRLGPVSSWLWRCYSKTPLLASILEDFPYLENRVTLGPTGRLQIAYRPRESEARRRAMLQGLLRDAFRGLRATLVSRRDAPKALGHVCGTCRFGNDPQSSVLDSENRAHGLDNFYIVDASFFPSSAGINPALTVAANALRVAERIVARL